MTATLSNKRKSFLIISWIIVLFWMGVIFYMSAQDGAESGSMSEPIARTVVEFQVKTGRTAPANLNSQYYIDQVEDLVRMYAHATIFFFLSVFVSISLLIGGMRGAKVFFLSILFSVLYAFMDELHQMFVPGRAHQMLDIFLDTLGVTIGSTSTLIMAAIVRRFRKPAATRLRPATASTPARVQTVQPTTRPKPVIVKPQTVQPKPVQQKPIQPKTVPIRPVQPVVKQPKKVPSLQIAILPIWMKAAIVISTGVLSGIISSSPTMMVINALLGMAVMGYLVWGHKLLDRHIENIRAGQAFIAIILAAVSIVQVYASFRLVANAYVASESIIISDNYYNFIRSGLSAFATPALVVLWYVLLDKVQQMRKHLHMTKLDIMTIVLYTGGVLLVCLYFYTKTSAPFMPTRDGKLMEHAVMSIDSSLILEEFSYTNFTSRINNLLHPSLSLAAFPWGVLSKLIAYPLSIVLGINGDTASAIGLTTINAMAMVTGAVLLSHAFDSRHRYLLVLLIMASYPVILLSAQLYITPIVFFYTALAIYAMLRMEQNPAPYVALAGVAFAPMIFLSFMGKKRGRLFIQTLGLAIAMIALSGRMNIITDWGVTLVHTPTIPEVFQTYIQMASISLVSPVRVVQQNPFLLSASYSTLHLLLGSGIIAAAVLGFWFNRKKPIAQMCMTGLVLCIGSIIWLLLFHKPNNFIVYAITFSWAFIGLNYLLIQHILRKQAGLTRILLMGMIGVLAVYNIHNVYRVIVFGMNYYHALFEVARFVPFWIFI